MNTSIVLSSRIGTLPQDLIEKIWSYNYFWAATIIQKHTKRFIHYKVEHILQIWNTACDFGNNPTMLNHNLIFNNRTLTKLDILNTMNACKCCPRHQINKPKKLEKWQETPLHNHDYFISCYCECRHLSRFICRGVS